MAPSHVTNVIKLPRPSGKIANGVHVIDNLASLQEHLQIAVMIELGTIPLYLFARYSILPGDLTGIGAGEVIRSVVQEEMLHLALACNLLKSVGGTPKLYSFNPFPAYPLIMPHHSNNFTLNLRQADMEQIGVFCQVELPEKSDAPPQPDNYETIGQYYDAIVAGFQYLTNQGGTVFDPTSLDFQFQGPDGVYAGTETGGLVTVRDLPSAQLACTTIIDQGEGNNQTVFVDPSDTEVAHYFKFRAILSGVAPNCFNLISNPSTAVLAELDPTLGLVSELFDACYCFILLCIEQSLQVSFAQDPTTRAKITANYVEFMTNVIRRIAVFLVSQPYPDLRSPSYNCAPAFNLYDFYAHSSTMMPLAQVQGLATAVVEAYGSSVPPILAPLPSLLKNFNELPFQAPKLT